MDTKNKCCIETLNVPNPDLIYSFHQEAHPTYNSFKNLQLMWTTTTTRFNKLFMFTLFASILISFNYL